MGQSCDEGSIHVHDSSKILLETHRDKNVLKKEEEEHRGESSL